MSPIVVDHRLLTKLRELDAAAARSYPTQGDPGFGSLGLILCELEQWDYWCTPTNVLTFATTGVDGLHFSFLVLANELRDDAPVVMTVPMPGGPPNWIVGENLYDFLCFGYFRGFGDLEQLPYNTDITVRAYTDPTWQPTEDGSDSFGDAPDDYRTPILQFLIEQLGLKPWKDSQHFERLQERYGGLLALPE